MDIAKIRERASKATPVPWSYIMVDKQGGWALGTAALYKTGTEEPIWLKGDIDGVEFDGQGNVVGEVITDEMICENYNSFNYADPRFIAHARSDVEALCDEVERLRAFAEQAMIAMDYAQAHMRKHFIPKHSALEELDAAMKVNPTNTERLNE